ncbi:hypothetical protein IX51_01880 [uncultured archaeon]|nr:hypothetical protein IX51_01880 [uncultured archaeon]HKJ96587.1 type II toxin-antitoxin system VapC family toxin [Thermoplasmataceae archaeon]
MSVARVYLDTSILVKRYIKEADSEIADAVFHQAQRGEAVICSSEINLGEAAVVFDKYSRKVGIDARDRLQTMLSELNSLERSSAFEIYPVSSHIIRKSISTLLEHHIYIVDAVQLETCVEAEGTVFFTADRELKAVAERIGLKTQL